MGLPDYGCLVVKTMKNGLCGGSGTVALREGVAPLEEDIDRTLKEVYHSA